MSDYRVVVSTCDKYLPYLKPFIHQFNRYWSKDQSVLVAGFTKPDFDMPRNFHFHSIGKQEDYPIDKWSDSIIKLCSQIVDETFVFMLEDYWITDTVDVEGVQLLIDHARQYPDIIRIDLTNDRYDTMHAHPEYKDRYDYKIGKLGHLDLIKSFVGAPYSLSMITSVWNKAKVMECIRPGWSPWMVETEGTRNAPSVGNDFSILGTEKSLVPHCVGVRQLNIGNNKLWLECGFFKQEDREHMQSLGILGETGFF